jgi:ComF family protein
MLRPFMRIHSHLRFIINKLMPLTCVMCGDYTQNTYNICTACAYNLPSLPHHCVQCAQFLPETLSATLCGTCLSHPPAYAATYALFPYEYPIISMIRKIKFQHQLCFAQALGELFAQKAQTTWYAHKPLPDLLIPIPLHLKRLSERGFNQALEIARPISKKLQLAIDYKGIVRSKATLAQSGLSAAKRAHNIANAFKVRRDYTGLKIALLDDVITTGHTITECSRMLKKHGAASIEIWCCARRGLPK